MLSTCKLVLGYNRHWSTTNQLQIPPLLFVPYYSWVCPQIDACTPPPPKSRVVISGFDQNQELIFWATQRWLTTRLSHYWDHKLWIMIQPQLKAIIHFKPHGLVLYPYWSSPMGYPDFVGWAVAPLCLLFCAMCEIWLWFKVSKHVWFTSTWGMQVQFVFLNKNPKVSLNHQRCSNTWIRHTKT